MRTDRDVLPQPAIAGAAIAGPAIRPGRDEDAAAYIALIARCWADYPGVFLYVDEEAPELRALATYYAALGGALWATDDVHGMVAAKPVDSRTWELCKVYVHPDLHGTGLAHRLMDIAEAHAVECGARQLELWTDTRFIRAHRFYEKRGYRRNERRELQDICRSEEWRYARPLA